MVISCVKFIPIWLSIFLFFCRNVYSDSRRVQEPIPDLEKALDMAAILLSGNIEEEIVILQGKKTGSLPITFENIYAELDRGEIILLKPTLKYVPSPAVNKMDLLLAKNHMTVAAEWKNVSIYASYESQYERDNVTFIRIDGQLSFRWDLIKASGPVGLSVAADKLKTRNNDLVFDFGNLSLDIVDHNSEHVKVGAIIRACRNIAPKLYWDLSWELMSTLESKLNRILRSSSPVIPSQGTIESYKDFNQNLANRANIIVDGFLKAFQRTIVERKIEKVPLRDVEKSVEAKLGIVSLQGDFKALNGTAGDLSTVRRNGDFSVWLFDNYQEISLAGFIEFADFSAEYLHYEAIVGNIKVLGRLRASATSNLVELKFRMITDSSSTFGYTFAVDKVRVVRLGHLSIEVTGMGALNNFVSLIASMVLNHFKADIVMEVNRNLEYIFKNMVNSRCNHFGTCSWTDKMVFQMFNFPDQI